MGFWASAWTKVKTWGPSYLSGTTKSPNGRSSIPGSFEFSIFSLNNVSSKCASGKCWPPGHFFQLDFLNGVSHRK